MKPPVEEWGRRLITWGKTHKDHSYEQVMRQDLGYFEWCQRRYASLIPEMKFLFNMGNIV